MKKFHVVTLGAVFTAVTVLSTGCGSSASKPAGEAASTPSTAVSDSTTKAVSTASAVPASSGDKELVVYSAVGFDQVIADAFEKKSGIKVKLVDDSTGPLLAKIQAEKANPQWDVTWFDGPSSMQGLDDQGLLSKDYIPANVNYTDLGKQLVPKDHAYNPITVSAAGAIAYNTDLVKTEDLPKDWSDLLKPENKGFVAMNNPSISGPTYSVVLGLMLLQGGIPQGQNFFTSLKTNGLNIFDKNGPTLTNLEKGNVKFAIAQDSAIIDKITKKSPMKLIYPASGVTTLSSNMAISTKAAHMDAAKKFIDYVLSVEGQNVAVASDAADANFQPIINGVTGKTNIRPDGIKWNTEDPVVGAQHENEVKQWFTQNIVQK